MQQHQTLLQTLRGATSSLHEEVESAPRLRALSGGELAADDYLEVLIGFWKFHALQHARLVDAWVPSGFGPRDGLRLLERDLDGVRLARPGATAPATGPVALGILYVVEGSALDRRVVGAGLRCHAELAGRTSFFSRPAPSIAARWQRFCAFLGRFDGRPPAFHEQVACGALCAFRDAKATFGDGQA
ncbi:MAG: biliverdin-producing heme oxygenase [Gammaproteobacteria bacterium]|nr:biliverdin-producing heme oxygenase [Gammaproteobacteria bacterium]